MGATSSAASASRTIETKGMGMLVNTVNRNVRLALARPSLTVTVTLAVPARWMDGIRVMDRLSPLPLNTIFAAGSRSGFEEVAARVSRDAGISGSLTEKKMAGMDVSSRVVWSAMAERLGGLLE